MGEITTANSKTALNVSSRAARAEQNSTNRIVCALNNVVTALTSLQGVITGQDLTPPSEGIAAINTVTVSDAGSIDEGKQSVTFLGISGTGLLVDGVALNVGESRQWDAYLNPVTNTYMKLPEITYDATDGVIRIITID